MGNTENTSIIRNGIIAFSIIVGLLFITPFLSIGTESSLSDVTGYIVTTREGDLNRDGFVNDKDRSLLLVLINLKVCSKGSDCDINNDGSFDNSDLTAFDAILASLDFSKSLDKPSSCFYDVFRFNLNEIKNLNGFVVQYVGLKDGEVLIKTKDSERPISKQAHTAFNGLRFSTESIGKKAKFVDLKIGCRDGRGLDVVEEGDSNHVTLSNRMRRVKQCTETDFWEDYTSKGSLKFVYESDTNNEHGGFGTQRSKSHNNFYSDYCSSINELIEYSCVHVNVDQDTDLETGFVPFELETRCLHGCGDGVCRTETRKGSNGKECVDGVYRFELNKEQLFDGDKFVVTAIAGKNVIGKDVTNNNREFKLGKKGSSTVVRKYTLTNIGAEVDKFVDLKVVSCKN